MPNAIIIILLIALGIFFLYCLITHFLTSNRLKRAFKEGNVVVTGRKGHGKDLLFQYIIRSLKSPYFSNISYGGDYTHIDPKELELTPNTYNNFIKGEVVTIEKNENLEGHDVYFSDAGVIFPSQADSTLHKTFPSLPISYALSRHLWNNGIHCNAQRMERIWKALREQADYYVFIRKRRLNLPFFLVVFTTEYTKYESALHELNPLGSRLFNKYSKAEKDKYKAEHGFIQNGFVIIPKWYIKYDSRAYHEIMYGEKAPRKEKNSWVKALFKKSTDSDESLKKENERSEE